MLDIVLTKKRFHRSYLLFLYLQSFNEAAACFAFCILHLSAVTSLAASLSGWWLNICLSNLLASLPWKNKIVFKNQQKHLMHNIKNK